MPQLTKRRRFEVLERDGFTCQYCGHQPQRLNRPGGGHGSATLHVDHVWPLAHGGMDFTENLVSACAKCNLTKNAKIWVPRWLVCHQCKNVDERPPDELVTIAEWGVFYCCGECQGRLDEGQRYMRAMESEDEEFSDLELEQRSWDALVFAGQDVL